MTNKYRKIIKFISTCHSASTAVQTVSKCHKTSKDDAVIVPGMTAGNVSDITGEMYKYQESNQKQAERVKLSYSLHLSQSVKLIIISSNLRY